jgi:hypothetical protein
MNGTSWMITRTLLRRTLPIAGWYWLVLLLAWAVVIGSIAYFGTIEASMWRNIGLQSPRWFSFVFGIIAIGTYLPMFVAQGVTRRAALLGSWGYFVPYAVIYAAMTTVGFGVEYLTFDILGVLGQLHEPYLVGSVADALRIFVEHSLVNLGYMMAGALCAVGYYQLSGWWATLLLPLMFLPAAGVETAFRTEWSGFVIARALGLAEEPSFGPAVLLAVLAIVTSAVVSWLSVRRLPLTKISG